MARPALQQPPSWERGAQHAVSAWGQDSTLVSTLQDGDKTTGVRQASSDAAPRVLLPVPSIWGHPCACPASPGADPRCAAMGRTRALTSTKGS